MKRDNFHDDGPSHKRNRYSNDEEVAFLIPSKVAGSIIGKGGTNISRLRKEYKASITVPDCPGPERVLTIASNDLEVTLDVIKDIIPSLAEGSKDEDYEMDVRILIHQSRAGCVIGKAGSKIKELREKTGARLKIFSNTAPQSTERVVQLLGNKESVTDAIKEVIELVRQTPIKGPVQSYDPHNYDDYYADEYGGFGSGGRGAGGGGANRGPMRGSGPSQNGPMGGGGRGPSRFGGGGGGGGPPMRAMQRPPPFDDFSGPRGNFGPGPDRNNFGGFNNGGNQDETSTQVTIPKDLAGAIIGKGGLRIRNIRQESGASIEIAEPLPGADDRIITITGSPHSIQMAQYLLQQSVHEGNPQMGRGGGGGGNNFNNY